MLSCCNSLSHRPPQLQDAPLKHSPDALKRDRKIAMRRGKGEIPELLSLLPPFPLQSTEIGRREGNLPPEEC